MRGLMFIVHIEGIIMTAIDLSHCVNEVCPWSGDPVSADSLTRYRGQVVGFCNPGCRDKFEAAINHFEKVIDEKAASV